MTAVKPEVCGNWSQLGGHDWSYLLEHQPRFADRCDWSKLEGCDWAPLLRMQPQFAAHCDWSKLDGCNWAGLLETQPQFAEYCDWDKLDGTDWAKLICEPSKNSSGPVIASNEGRWAVVNKMKELGVAVGVAGSNDAVVVGGFEWCCLFHWAEEYGSDFRHFAAARPNEEKIKYIAENSAMNPHGDVNGRYHSDIPKHIQWLAALAADFAAMSAEAAVPAPEYAEEYSLIAQAAAYEIKVLTPDDVSSARAQDVCRN